MKTQTLLLISFVLIFSFSCKKDKESPIACISGPEKVDRKQSASYEWCGSWVSSDDISWTTSWGKTGTGLYFFISETDLPAAYGKYTITATGKNKNGSASKSIEVEYGVFTQIKITATDNCYSGNQNIGSSYGYKLYSYGSLADWSSDLKNSTHTKALDSTGFNYSSENSTILATINTTAMPGTKLFFYVENSSNPNLSNANNLAQLAISPQTSGTYGQAVLTEWDNNYTSVSLDNASKRLLKAKWKMWQIELNGNTTTVPACNQDDYLVFNIDGSWNYEIGNDNCGGSNLPSNGRYTLPWVMCENSSEIHMSMTTLNGPLTGNNFVYSPNLNQVKMYYQSGSNTGYFIFNYSAN